MAEAVCWQRDGNSSLESPCTKIFHRKRKEKIDKPGATPTYTEQAIVTMVSLKSVFSLPGRALCGFVKSIFVLMQVDLSVPDHTTILRRLKRLTVTLPVVSQSGKRRVVIDSIGVKVYGEGE